MRPATRSCMRSASGSAVTPAIATTSPFSSRPASQILPTFAVTLGSPGMWIAAPEFGVDFAKLVHSEQAASFHAPLPPTADVVARAQVISLTDRGPGRGAVVVLERSIRDATGGAHYCTLRQTLWLRGDGGFGGSRHSSAPSVVPDRDAERRASAPVDLARGAHLSAVGRLESAARRSRRRERAGFDRPILHGLAPYGMAGVAVARACGHAPGRVKALRCRFSGVVFPGDFIDFRIWNAENRAMFQAFVGERKVLDQGLATFEAAQ